MSSAWKIAFLLVVACLSASVAEAQLLRKVAMTGDDAPGTEVGAKFGNVNWPVLNAGGQVAFSATLTNTDLFNDQGVWSEGSGPLGLVARRGDPAPGTAAGVTFDYFGDVALNDSGQSAFFSHLRGPGVFAFNDYGVWSQGTGSLEKVVRSGDPAPGTPSGVTFISGLIEPVFNGGGRSAFLAQVTGNAVSSADDWGIWAEGPLALVAREGNQAPGLPAGVNYYLLGQPSLNSAGQMIFFGRVVGTGITTANDDVIWSNRTGTIAAVVREGNAAVGVGPGVTFGSIGASALNAHGTMVFQSLLSGGSLTSANDGGIWSEQSGVISLVVREGSHAAGTPAGANFDNFDSPVVNNNGQIAFRGRLTGTGVGATNGQGIWSDGFGGQHLVARTGDQAPGTPVGAMFNRLGVPVFNSVGQTAFEGFLTGGGVYSWNSQGIWAEDQAGLLRLIARAGDLLEVSPGDFRTIASLGFRPYSNNDSGRPSGFNDLGQLAFLAQFTDGTSGVFVSSLAAVPEPPALVLCSAVLGVVLLRRTRASR